MKRTIKLITYLNAVLVYLILFYSTSLFSKTFSETFNVNLGGLLTIQTDTDSINKQLTEDANLTTSDGSITAYLITDIQIDIDASTSGGRVKVTSK
ncbi:hypothetical protein [Paraglaciecola arctica]|uniref:Uncharacterized protein n=1 Tax=Paraglaciecola arctica BSs20135 TaxID=493475 RepID=K6Z0Q4_9ALTE|nr:hypothetical protein [Paraglaciecola arctica]GAC17040.1 hypothetical protein GARC_0058 [Paraglaciecola arctica BSs20135]